MKRVSTILGLLVLSGAPLAHAAVELACTQTGNAKVESIVLRKEKTWTSAAGGWLTSDKGKWVQKSIEGLVLQNTAGKELGMVKGLIFDKAIKGAVHVFRFDAGGNTGSCVVNTTDL